MINEWIDENEKELIPASRVFHGDCRKVLSSLDEGSFDLLVTDPPYRLNDTSGSMTSSSKTEKWTGHLKAGDTTANIQNEIEFKEWLPIVYRSLRDPSHAYIFCNDKNLHKLINSALSVGFRLHNVLVWKKNNVTPNRWYMKNCEFVVFLHKGKSFPIAKLGSAQFLPFENISGVNKTVPTEKPVELLKLLIENSSDYGGLVLDPFCGSGSTGIASLLLNRLFVGIDISEECVNLTRQKIITLISTRTYASEEPKSEKC